MGTEKILLVDDDPNLLAAVKRQFRNKLNLTAAPSAADALTAIEYQGPFAVVVSDMQMPHMNGVEMLAKIKAKSPDTVRIMLTGNANLQTAIDSVNEGHIFRFLTKPCSPELLYRTIVEAIRLYRLQRSEQELLSKTLKGAVSLLTDVLSIVNPDAFSQASRIQRYVHQMVAALGLRDAWSYELAAMLSQLGRIAMPTEAMAQEASGLRLTENDQAAYLSHPEIAQRLLGHIPRLEVVSAMVKKQEGAQDLPDLKGDLSPEEKAIVGGHLLKVAIAYDERLNSGESSEEAIRFLRGQPHIYDPGIVAVLESVGTDQHEVIIQKLPVSGLRPGMIVDQNVYSSSGVLYVAKGHEVTPMIQFRLMGLEASGLWSGEIQVVVNKRV